MPKNQMGLSGSRCLRLSPVDCIPEAYRKSQYIEHHRSLYMEGGKGREALCVTARSLLLRIEVAGVTPEDVKV